MHRSNDFPARFRRLFDSLGCDSLDGLSGVYAPEVVFEDPFHRIEGLPALEAYFVGMYQEVESCSFEWGASAGTDVVFFQEWTMHLRHRKFRPGKTVAVPGCTSCRLVGELAISHRDHFDAGVLIYERVPVLGTLVKFIKGRVGS